MPFVVNFFSPEGQGVAPPAFVATDTGPDVWLSAAVVFVDLDALFSVGPSVGKTIHILRSPSDLLSTAGGTKTCDFSRAREQWKSDSRGPTYYAYYLILSVSWELSPPGGAFVVFATCDLPRMRDQPRGSVPLRKDASPLTATHIHVLRIARVPYQNPVGLSRWAPPRPRPWP